MFLFLLSFMIIRVYGYIYFARKKRNFRKYGGVSSNCIAINKDKYVMALFISLSIYILYLMMRLILNWELRTIVAPYLLTTALFIIIDWSSYVCLTNHAEFWSFTNCKSLFSKFIFIFQKVFDTIRAVINIGMIFFSFLVVSYYYPYYLLAFPYFLIDALNYKDIISDLKYPKFYSHDIYSDLESGNKDYNEYRFFGGKVIMSHPYNYSGFNNYFFYRRRLFFFKELKVFDRNLSSNGFGLKNQTDLITNYYKCNYYSKNDDTFFIYTPDLSFNPKGDSAYIVKEFNSYILVNGKAVCNLD